jgi:hypothetical protein
MLSGVIEIFTSVIFFHMAIIYLFTPEDGKALLKCVRLGNVVNT